MTKKLLTLLAVFAMVGAGTLSLGGTNLAGGRDAAELLEQRNGARARVDALQVAVHSGQNIAAPVTTLATPGWDGSSLFSGNGNDWEPDIAADPNGPYVYWVTTRYGDRACANCPNGQLMVRVSSDNGDTWGPANYLCECKGKSWQADPTVVVDDNGTVYSTILSQWHSYLTKSTDHGATWSTPVDVAPDFGVFSDHAFTDHEFVTVSPDGNDVYMAFNSRNSFVVASHDGGTTWGTPVRTNPPGDAFYYYSYHGVATNGFIDRPAAAGPSSGEVWIAATSVTREPEYANSLVRYWVLHSTDGGATFEQILIDTTQQQPSCKNPSNPTCRADHFGGLCAIARDSDGNLVYTYAGSRKAQKGELIFVRTSANGGATWTDAKRVSPARSGDRRVIGVFPAITAGGPGDFRLVYMDNRIGLKRWNEWYRSSGDGGATWTADERLSDATGGPGYVHGTGFDADYGDYQGVDILSDGRTLATWGEGFGYYGPGGTWINRQTGGQ